MAIVVEKETRLKSTLDESQSLRRVAVIGSGLAGLTSAWLINQDPGYDVTIFELVCDHTYFQTLEQELTLQFQQDCLSLGSASVSVPISQDELHSRTTCKRQIDIPMRAFAGGMVSLMSLPLRVSTSDSCIGYYPNLRRLYDHLNIGYHPQRLLFHFRQTQRGSQPYFIHASGNHQVPPPRPPDSHTLNWVLEVVFVVIFYYYFTFCCFCIPPQRYELEEDEETISDYLNRIHLPLYFTKYYLLPLMSSVATCTHEQLLDFPARDILEYKRTTHKQEHYFLDDGVALVQRALSSGVSCGMGACVTSVESLTNGQGKPYVQIKWRSSADRSPSVSQDFDYVVLAVAPNVIQAIYKPLSQQMSRIPTVTVGSDLVQNHNWLRERSWRAFDPQPRPEAEKIHLNSDEVATEAVHEHPNAGVQVQTRCLLPTERHRTNRDTSSLQRSIFTRVLRTPDSRRVVNEIFEPAKYTDVEKESQRPWRNGDGNVFLAGGFCWDGLVLLEGCVVSAMRVARALDVDIPWEDDCE